MGEEIQKMKDCTMTSVINRALAESILQGRQFYMCSGAGVSRVGITASIGREQEFPFEIVPWMGG
jgi:hypothetical protein